jgi:hypothetical protein
MPSTVKPVAKSRVNTAKEILDQFDQCAEPFTFPLLANGYIFNLLGHNGRLKSESTPVGLWVMLPAKAPCDFAVTLKIKTQ